jgi:hypothetical protein
LLERAIRAQNRSAVELILKNKRIPIKILEKNLKIAVGLEKVHVGQSGGVESTAVGIAQTIRVLIKSAIEWKKAPEPSDKSKCSVLYINLEKRVRAQNYDAVEKILEDIIEKVLRYSKDSDRNKYIKFIEEVLAPIITISNDIREALIESSAEASEKTENAVSICRELEGTLEIVQEQFSNEEEEFFDKSPGMPHSHSY